MKPTVERLTEQFTKLIGPEAFAKAEAAIAAARVAAEAAAKAAAEKAAAAAASKPTVVAAVGDRGPANPPGSRPPATTEPPTAVAAVHDRGPVPSAQPAPAAPATAKPATAVPAPAAAPRPSPAAPTAVAAPRPAPAPVPAPAPLPTLPVQVTSHAAKGYDFDATVAPAQVVRAAELLDADGFALDTITGVDWIAQNEMEVVYDYFHAFENLRVVIRTRLPRATPELPSITAVYPGANWHERETHDFFGIRFTGHPNLKPFLLPEDANFHPLRKDYQP